MRDRMKKEYRPKDLLPQHKHKIMVHSIIRRWDEFVPRAIGSVMEQTYTNWEYHILTGEESHDNIAEFCKDFPNIILMPNEEKGKSPYELADVIIKTANTGDYFTTIDGDDRMDETFMEKALAYTLKHDLDICGVGICSVQFVDGQEEVIEIARMEGDFVLERKDFARNIQAIHPHIWTMWGKLSKSSIYRSNLYEGLPSMTRRSLDVAITYPSLKNAKKMGALAEVGYYYTNNPEGITYVFGEAVEEDAFVLHKLALNMTANINLDRKENMKPYVNWVHQLHVFYYVSILFESNRTMEDKIKLAHYMCCHPVTKELFTDSAIQELKGKDTSLRIHSAIDSDNYALSPEELEMLFEIDQSIGSDFLGEISFDTFVTMTKIKDFYGFYLIRKEGRIRGFLTEAMEKNLISWPSVLELLNLFPTDHYLSQHKEDISAVFAEHYMPLCALMTKRDLSLLEEKLLLALEQVSPCSLELADFAKKYGLETKNQLLIPRSYRVKMDYYQKHNLNDELLALMDEMIQENISFS